MHVCVYICVCVTMSGRKLGGQQYINVYKYVCNACMYVSIYRTFLRTGRKRKRQEKGERRVGRIYILYMGGGEREIERERKGETEGEKRERGRERDTRLWGKER